MMDVLIGLSILLLVFIGCIHVYWAFGGKWGVGVAVPTGESQQPTFAPGTAGTLMVALLLFGASLLLMVQGNFLPSIPSYPIAQLENPFLCGLRNSVMRLIPPSIQRKQLNSLYNVDF